MRPEEWSRVKDVFAAVLPLDAEARAAYLHRVCGEDGTLRQHVESLLHSYAQAPSFLEAPPPELTEAMSAKPLDGLRVGPYQLSVRIGAGGMGDVYKARDTRLDRLVAVKVLPAHVADDPLARDRFEREARAVAALNHPHICTLHDIGSQDGIDFLVMEYLEGETLAARLARGPLGLQQALRYGVQIASALDRVHRAGIVHRDLKPSNIMLTKAGAKLLDFGLSKATALQARADLPQFASSLDITSAGMILGTVPYMAPEQFEGGTTDARADLFAFGAVLYEMIGARKAFGGDDFRDVMTAIKEREPASLPEVPPSVDRIVRTCLAKDPDDRWQTARDLLRELTWVADGGSDALRAPTVLAARAPRRDVVWGVLGAAVIVFAIALSGLRSLNPSRNTDSLPARFEVATPPTSDPMSFALSADGRQLVFVATSDGLSKLWVRPIDQLEARTLPGTEGASFPFWSPDGLAIGFFADGRLKRLDVAGGLPRTLADAATGRGGTWSANGTIIFAPSTVSPLMRISTNGGTVQPATRFSTGDNSHRWPQFLPDGERFLFLSTQGLRGTEGVFVGSLDGSPAKRILDGDSPAAYVPPDRLLFAREGTLVAAPFDISRLVVTGEPTPVIQPIGFDSLLVRPALATSQSGVLAHRTAIADRRQLMWVDRAGAFQGSLGPTDDDGLASPELSPDGRSVAVFRTVEGNADVWLMHVDNPVPSRFTLNAKVDGFPVWSSDGRRVLFISNRNGDYGIMQRPMTGASNDETVLRQPGLNVPIPVDFSPDGRFLLYAVKDPATGIDLRAQPLAGNATPIAVAQTPFDEMAGQFSPDGGWVAYQSTASGRLEVYVSPFPGPGGQQQVSSAGGSQPRWRPDGKELFYIAPDGRLMGVPIQVGSSGRVDASTPLPLFQTRLATGANIPPAVGSRAQYDVSSDGRFLMNVSVEGAAAPPIAIALNWQAGLNK